MDTVRRSQILGTGSYLPARVMSNEEVSRGAPGCDPDWIERKLGILERRIAAPDEQTSDLAVNAAVKALEMAGLEASQLDGIICSVGSGDVPVPATACYIQDKLGISQGKGFAFDVKMACAGAVGGTMLARGLIESGIAQTILVVGTQIISRTTLDWTDRTTAPIFGDGAGAVIMGPATEPGQGILQSKLRTDGSLAGIVGQYVGGTEEWYSPEAFKEGRIKLEMDGRAVWDCAVRELPAVIREVVKDGGHTIEDVDFVVAHQANKRLLTHVLELVGVPLDKSYTNIERYGNTVAASAFVALDECVRQGKITRGDLVILVAIGAGMIWGAHLIRW
jgi:3-oxoacyl-[acyl-carrier-protein] synthase-3